MGIAVPVRSWENSSMTLHDDQTHDDQKSDPPNPYGPRLAPYACHPEHSRGRQFQDSPSPGRSPFQRDRDRVIHSAAFRRLKHKTQVFVYHVGDHYRTRLTHSLEVSQIARTVSRALGLNEDLAETLALAHDLGHTPFGHAGEEALNRALANHGGFDHNAQTLRILTRLERRYADFDGLNLTWESLEGVVKHNGPLLKAGRENASALPQPIRDFDAVYPLDLASHASAEAQVAAIADDIAYNNHDIDDGLRSGLIAVGDLLDLPLVGALFRDVSARYPGLEPSRLIHEAVRRMINTMVCDLMAETAARLAELAPASVGAIRRHTQPVVAFSPAMAENVQILRRFLFERLYRHEQVLSMTENGQRVISDLFAIYCDQEDTLPESWRQQAMTLEPTRKARVIGDYIAGMTDRYALREHRRLFGGDTGTGMDSIV